MRADIVALARGWLGTPYHHQASLKGVGCDCLGLIRGVYAEACGQPAETPPPYSRDWAEASARETMIEAASRHLTPIDPGDAEPGDVLIFRLRPGAMAKHCAIVTGEVFGGASFLLGRPASAGLFGPLSRRPRVSFCLDAPHPRGFLAHLTGGPQVPDPSAEQAAGTAFVAVSRGPQAGPCAGRVPGSMQKPGSQVPDPSAEQAAGAEFVAVSRGPQAGPRPERRRGPPEKDGLPQKIIHAIEGAPVCEVHLTPWWRRRIAAAFRFPD